MADCTGAGIFSTVLSLQVHWEISEQFFPPAPQLALSGSSGSRWKSAWPDAEAASLCRQAAVCSSRAWVLQCTVLQLPGLSLSQVPWEPLLWRIPFGFTGPRGGAARPLGRAPQSPTLGATCKLLSEGARAQPSTGCSRYPIVCGVGRLFPADLPVRGEM